MPIRPLPIYATDQLLYEALLRRDERAYQYLYADVQSAFRHWMLTNNGSDEDANDAFQKGMMSFLLNIETGAYQLQSGTRITTVVFEYCKRVWFTELKSARLRTRATMPADFDTADTTDIEKDLERFSVVDAVRQSMGQLKEDCRKLLEWFYMEEMSLRDIAERLGIKESSVKSKRYDCAEKMKVFYQQTASGRNI